MRLDALLDDNLDLLKQVFENTVSPMVVTEARLEEPGPRFVYVNKAFEQMTGYSKDELQDKTPRILQGEKSNRIMLDELKAALKKGEFFTGHTTNYRKDGSTYDVEWTISPIKNKQGEVQYFFSVQKDITAQQMLRQREQELFFHQSRMAAMGEMIDGIAHQFKQPLSTINIKAQQLLLDLQMHDQLDPGRVKTAAEKITAHVGHLGQTIDEFRSFFIEQKETRTISLDKLIEETYLLSQDSLHQAGIEFVHEQSGCTVTLYPNEFKHVILNILLNAKDAFEENKPKERRIKASTKCDENGTILQICDNAGGIDPKILDTIFEPRFSTKGKDEGSGIGLYLVRQIAAKINATVHAYNKDGGACFEINIPYTGAET